MGRNSAEQEIICNAKPAAFQKHDKNSNFQTGRKLTALAKYFEKFEDRSA